MRSKSVKEWLAAMKNHSCESKNLTSEDDYHHLAINYSCSCGETFSISLVSFKETLDELETEKRKILKELIKSHAGREALVKSLNNL
jgi:hypothetical protein